MSHNLWQCLDCGFAGGVLISWILEATRQNWRRATSAEQNEADEFGKLSDARAPKIRSL